MGLLFFGRWTQALRSICLLAAEAGWWPTVAQPHLSHIGYLRERYPVGISDTASNCSGESLNRSQAQKTSQCSLQCKSIFSLLSSLRLWVWTAISFNTCWFTGFSRLRYVLTYWHTWYKEGESACRWHCHQREFASELSGIWRWYLIPQSVQ